MEYKRAYMHTQIYAHNRLRDRFFELVGSANPGGKYGVRTERYNTSAIA